MVDIHNSSSVSLRCPWKDLQSWDKFFNSFFACWFSPITGSHLWNVTCYINRWHYSLGIFNKSLHCPYFLFINLPSACEKLWGTKLFQSHKMSATWIPESPYGVKLTQLETTAIDYYIRDKQTYENQRVNYWVATVTLINTQSNEDRVISIPAISMYHYLFCY